MNNEIQIEFKLNTAKNFIKSGKNLHAIQIYKALIEENSQNLDLHIQLSQLYINIGINNNAIKLLNNFILKNSDNIEAKIFLSQILIKEERWEEIVVLLADVIADEDPDILFILGYANYQIENYEISKNNFHKIFNYKVDTEIKAQSYLYLSKNCIKLFQFDDALDYAKKAEPFYNNNWEYQFILAQIYFNKKMFTHAKQNIESCIKLNGKSKIIYRQSAKIYFELSDYTNSLKYYLKIINEGNNISADIYIELSNVYQKLDEMELALKYVHKVLEQEPKHIRALSCKQNILNLLVN